MKRNLTLIIFVIVGLIFVVFVSIVFTLLAKVFFSESSSVFYAPAYANERKVESNNNTFEYDSSKSNLVEVAIAKENIVEEKNDAFVIKIPKISLEKNIIKNVNPISREEYLTVIETDVAHGKWTYTPDEALKQGFGITYLFAHRDGEHGFFNRLGELSLGDQILIDYNGSIFEYQVKNKYIVDPSETDFYTSLSPTPTLRLQTCENGISQRLMIDAELIE